MSQGRPGPERRGCSVGVVLLSLLTCAVLLCLLPHALWFPFGAFYASFPHREDVSAGFPRAAGNVVWAVVALLALPNLLWMAYALCRWRTRPLPPEPPPPAIPEGAGDRLAKQPPSPQVKPEGGIHEGAESQGS